MRTRYAFLPTFLAVSLLLAGFTNAQTKKPGPIAPAEKLAEGWDEIDQRLIFLMVRLANVEASLDAVEKAIGKSTGKRSSNLSAAKRAEAGNDLMDRKAGGPVKWSEFYGRTAEAFFYHPVDANTTYHTTTVLSQQGPRADNKVGGGVPAGQGLPVHQRPPQFDYIYRANENAKARAEEEAAELQGKVDALLERRRRLEAEQAGLWCEIAFRAVAHYDLDKKPLYRFEPLAGEMDTTARQHAETAKAAAHFMRLALSIVDEAQKDQAATFSRIKPAVADARQKLGDAWLRQAVDATDRKTIEGKFAALAKRLDDVASNLSDSYIVANEGDAAKDQQRKDTFRALLQDSLVNYAQIVLALDEMATLMKDEWKIKPDVDKPIQSASLAIVEATGLASLPSVPPVSVENSPPVINGGKRPAAFMQEAIIGRFDISWTEDSGVSGAITYDFLPTHIAMKEQRPIGHWQVKGEGVELTFDDPKRGVVVITLRDSDHLFARHTWANGTTATWDGKRIGKHDKADGGPKPAQQKEAALRFAPLFDGKSLKGWKGDGSWYVVNGAIVGHVGPNGSRSYLSTTGTYHNFVLQARFKVASGDAGVLFRGKPNWLYAMQVLVGPWKAGGLIDETPRERDEPLRWVVDNPDLERLFRQNDWNTIEISAQGNQVRCKLNGQSAFDTQYDDGPRAGVISLKANKNTHAEFTDIKIARLPD